MITLNELFLLINAISCAVTAITLGTFQRRGSTHRPLAAFFAWLLIVACGSVTILIMTGMYAVANPAETAINIALCVAVVSARGNVMKIIQPSASNTDNNGKTP